MGEAWGEIQQFDRGYSKQAERVGMQKGQILQQQGNQRGRDPKERNTKCCQCNQKDVQAKEKDKSCWLESGKEEKEEKQQQQLKRRRKKPLCVTVGGGDGFTSLPNAAALTPLPLCAASAAGTCLVQWLKRRACRGLCCCTSSKARAS